MTQQIISWKQAKELGLKSYFTGKPCPQGHIVTRQISGGCMQCKRDENKKWRDKQPLGRTLEAAAKWRKENPQRFANVKREWRKRNPHKHIAYRAARKAAKLRATPLWANLKAIALIYEEAAKKGLSVDHIIPLQGKKVCGLHVANNLQLMPLAANLAKGNKFDGVE